MKRVIYHSVLFVIMISCTNRKERIERKYFDTGELRQTVEMFSKDSIYCIQFYKNGHKQFEGLLGRDSSFTGFCKEYYSDGFLKWSGRTKNGCPLLMSRPGFSIKNDIVVNIQGNPDTLIKGKSYGIRVRIEGVYPTAFFLKYSNQKKVVLNTKDPDLYPYIITPEKKGTLNVIIQIIDDDGTFHESGDEIIVHIPCR